MCRQSAIPPVVHVPKKKHVPKKIPKPVPPKKFVRPVVEREEYVRPPTPEKIERKMQAPPSIGMAAEVPKVREHKGLPPPPKKVLTSQSKSARDKRRRYKPKADPTKATAAPVGFGGIGSVRAQRPPLPHVHSRGAALEALR